MPLQQARLLMLGGIHGGGKAGEVFCGHKRRSEETGPAKRRIGGGNGLVSKVSVRA